MFRGAGAAGSHKERNIGSGTLIFLSLVCVSIIAGVYYTMLQRNIPLTIVSTVAMIAMAFFFTAVASYIVGLVGNSNSPVSGMTISAMLGTGVMIWLFGFTGEAAIAAALGVAGVVCCVACTSGDVCNDLKTGHLVGASPRNQQLMQVLGVVVGSLIMAPVLSAMHKSYVIGSSELPAPQAGLFTSLANGLFRRRRTSARHARHWRGVSASAC